MRPTSRTASPGVPADMKKRVIDIFRDLDKNGDGVVTQQEFEERMAELQVIADRRRTQRRFPGNVPAGDQPKVVMCFYLARVLPFGSGRTSGYGYLSTPAQRSCAVQKQS